MSIRDGRTRITAHARSAWRERTSASVVPFTAQLRERGHIAFVFSLGEDVVDGLRPALAGLEMTTIARFFDAHAAEVVRSAAPELVVLACDPTKAAGLQAIGLLSYGRAWRFLVIDTSELEAGAPAALDAGADMVLSNRADAHLVRASLHALLRRSRAIDHFGLVNNELAAVVGHLTIDEDTFKVRDSGELVGLTPTEFKVLADLVHHSGLVRSPSQLMAALHDYPVSDAEARQAIRVYVRRIRNKLALRRGRSVDIVSYRGRGYRLEPTELFELEPSPGATSGSVSAQGG